MKKRISTISLCALLCLSGAALIASCQSNNPGPQKPADPQPQEEKFEFAQAEFEVASGTKVVISGDATGVTYSFQGGTPEGVTLNETTGEITFDKENDTLTGTYVYIATKGDKTATTKIKFKIEPAVPVVTFTNISKYLVNGETVNATAISTSGKEFAVSYTLKTAVDGISIDETTGKVAYDTKLANNTHFVVVATSTTITAEFEFIAMTSGFVTTDTSAQIIEKGSNEEASFVLNYNGNTEADTETTAENIKIAINNKVTDGKGVTYDTATKTVKLSKELLATLPGGEVDIRVLTQRNAVALDLIIADKFLYTGEDFYNVFTPNYGAGIPTFKENSLNGYYVLGADIDLSEYLSVGGLGYNDGKGWMPIGAYADGEYDVPFTGTFNGLGHTISGFEMKKATSVNGFFGRNSGTIKNFTLKGEIAPQSWSSVLCGNNSETGLIENVIIDVPLINEGQATTGTIASVNWGTIRSSLSINPKVQGLNEKYDNWEANGLRPFAKSGVAVGLNEATGVIENVYGLTRKAELDRVYGSNNNTNLKIDETTKVFGTIEEMKAFDFNGKLNAEAFNLTANELPTLNTLFEPLSAGYLSITNLPKSALKSDIVELDVKILPSKYEETLKPTVKYEVSGCEGLTLEGNKLSFANATIDASGSTITVKATLDHDGKILTDTKTFTVFNNVGAITISKIDAFEVGKTYKLEAITDPVTANPQITWKTDLGWRSVFATLKDGEITLHDDFPTNIEAITITAEGYGIASEPLVVPVKHMHTFANNNVVHFKEDKGKDFEYTLPATATKITNVVVNGKALTAEQFTFTAGKLAIKPALIELIPGSQYEVTIHTENEAKVATQYRAFATFADTEKRDKNWLLNAFGAGAFVEISTKEQFKDIFYNADPAKLQENLHVSKVYLLTADIDLAGEELAPIGTGLPEGQEHFNGQLYGNGHTIKGLTQTAATAGEGGLFKQVEGRVYDLNLENFNINKTSHTAGTLSAFGGGAAVIENINVINSVITNKEAIPANNVENQVYVGGIIGRSWTKEVKYSTFNGYNLHLKIGNGFIR